MVLDFDMGWFGHGLNLLLVDHHGHSTLAMLALGAVEPHRGRGIDCDGIGRDRSSISLHTHEAGVDASEVGVRGKRLAGLIEGRLSDGVVCWGELELNHVTHSGDDVVG